MFSFMYRLECKFRVVPNGSHYALQLTYLPKDKRNIIGLDEVYAHYSILLEKHFKYFYVNYFVMKVILTVYK